MWGTVVDDDTCRDLLATYLEAGGTLLDTAYGYGLGASESLIGRLLGAVVPRDDLVLCTKAGAYARDGRHLRDTSRAGLLRHLEASLSRLGTDYVDLWLVHDWSDGAPLEETLGALEYAVTSGRARYVGVSNYSGWQAARAFSLLENARIPLLANQVEYSLVNRAVEDDVLPAAEALGFGLLAYSPLGGGVLTGKYRNGVPSGSRAAMRQFPGFVRDRLDANAMAIVEAVTTAAAGLGVSACEVALAWVRDRPSVAAPVVGSRTVAQLRTALASEELELPPEIVAALDEVSD
jgi:aryl-alcohol dehydrogenase-like predicted oxidoreductase